MLRINTDKQISLTATLKILENNEHQRQDEIIVANDSIEIPKENITKIEEPPIVIDQATGETIPPLTVHIVPGVYEEHHDVTPEVLEKETKYDYGAEFAFAEKKKSGLDGGAF